MLGEVLVTRCCMANRNIILDNTLSTPPPPPNLSPRPRPHKIFCCGCWLRHPSSSLAEKYPILLPVSTMPGRVQNICGGKAN